MYLNLKKMETNTKKLLKKMKLSPKKGNISVKEKLKEICELYVRPA